jgi:hypothetical protein
MAGGGWSEVSGAIIAALSGSGVRATLLLAVCLRGVTSKDKTR